MHFAEREYYQSIMTGYTWKGLEALDANLSVNGCSTERRIVALRRTGGWAPFGVRIVEPKTTYEMICNSKKGAACGGDCPAGILKSRLAAYHRESKRLSQ